MWERAQLKERAKSVLKGSYWKAFLVSIVTGMASGGGSFNAGGSMNPDTYGGFKENPEDLLMILMIVGVIVLVALVIGTAIKIFVGYHLEVGGSRYFLQAAQGDVDMGYLGYTFKNGRYLSVIKTMFLKNLMIGLWSLLLIIPGIIKTYAYILVPYILADNPSIGSKRALELSNQMTRGHKFNIFVLQLSFIGWYLLGLLGCCVGMIFVVPYQYATQAELYLVLRQQAIEQGLCDYKELNLMKHVKEAEYNNWK